MNQDLRDFRNFLGVLVPFALLVGIFVFMVANGMADDTMQRSPLITPSTIPYECGVYVTDGPVMCWPEGETP